MHCVVVILHLFIPPLVNPWPPAADAFLLQAAYIRVPAMARLAAREAGCGWREGLHAASHAMLNCVPLHLLCDATDMGTECDNPYDSRFRPERLLLYDKHPGGIGLAAQARAFAAAARWGGAPWAVCMRRERVKQGSAATERTLS